MEAGPGHTKTLASASAPALAMKHLVGWNATSWMDSWNFLRWAVNSWMQVLSPRFHRRMEQSWPARGTRRNINNQQKLNNESFPCHSIVR